MGVFDGEKEMEHKITSDSSTSLRTAFLLNLAFTLLEVVAGLLVNSVAILSDAVHDLGDSVSLGLAWLMEGYSQRRHDQRYSYGYRRFNLLGALVNTILLLAGSIFILSEAIPRLAQPEQPYAPGMLLVAVVGLVVNGAAVYRLRREKSLGTRVVAWHLLEDVLGWAAVLVVSVAMLFTDAAILDPILSILITLYVLYNVLKNLRKTLSLFLQAVPEDVEIREIESRLQAVPNVCSVHHTHVWSLDGESHVLSTHVVLEEDATREDAACVKEQVRKLSAELNLAHATVEIEYGEEDCGMAPARNAECDEPLKEEA
jgi:cobalt-zinc-cadmium efflux system protein